MAGHKRALCDHHSVTVSTTPQLMSYLWSQFAPVDHACRGGKSTLSNAVIGPGAQKKNLVLTDGGKLSKGITLAWDSEDVFQELRAGPPHIDAIQAGMYQQT